MPIDPQELQKLQKQYHQVTGESFSNFYCPILHEDSSGTGLIMGHVINEKVISASRARVIQRGDIDGHFGTKLEPELIDFVNRSELLVRERVASASKFEVVANDGRRWPAFPVARSFINANQPKFAQLDLVDQGKPFLSVVAKGDRDEIEALEGSLHIEAISKTLTSAVIGSLIKAAYLALFRECGYLAAIGPCADLVRTPLADFFRKNEGKEAAEYRFGKFRNACNVVHLDSFDQADTPTDHLVFVHNLPDGLLFAMSALLRMNTDVFAVTLPFSFAGHDPQKGIKEYERFISEPALEHEIHAAWVIDRRVHIVEKALPLKFFPR